LGKRIELANTRGLKYRVKQGIMKKRVKFEPISKRGMTDEK